MTLKIVLVDDQPVPGLTLRRWLRKQRDLEVVGEAVPGSPVLALIQLTEPDAVLLDVLTSPEAGLNVARLIRESYPTVPVVAIGDPSAASIRLEAAEAGAWAFMPKTTPEDLAKAIPSVIARKGAFVDLSDRTFHRPPTEGFVAAPGQEPKGTARSESFVALPEDKPRTRAGSESFVALPEDKRQRRVAEPPVPAPTPAPAVAPKTAPTAAPRVSPRATPKAAPPAAAPRQRDPKLPAATGPNVSAPIPTVAPAPSPKASPAAAPKPAAKAVPSPAPTEKARRERPAPAATSTQSPFELVSPSRRVSPREAVARTHSAIEPVFDSPPQKKRRRRRGKQEEVPVETDVRGAYGLPRRYGGHR